MLVYIIYRLNMLTKLNFVNFHRVLLAAKREKTPTRIFFFWLQNSFCLECFCDCLYDWTMRLLHFRLFTGNIRQAACFPYQRRTTVLGAVMLRMEAFAIGQRHNISLFAGKNSLPVVKLVQACLLYDFSSTEGA